MKLAGVDGIILDWYGIHGSNGDIESLQRNSIKVIEAIHRHDLKFCIMIRIRLIQGIKLGSHSEPSIARRPIFSWCKWCTAELSTCPGWILSIADLRQGWKQQAVDFCLRSKLRSDGPWMGEYSELRWSSTHNALFQPESDHCSRWLLLLAMGG